MVLNGVHYYCVAGRFASFAGDRNLGYVLLNSQEQSLVAMEATQGVLLVMILLAILFCAAAVWFFVSRVTKPLRELRQAPRRSDTANSAGACRCAAVMSAANWRWSSIR